MAEGVFVHIGGEKGLWNGFRFDCWGRNVGGTGGGLEVGRKKW